MRQTWRPEIRTFLSKRGATGDLFGYNKDMHDPYPKTPDGRYMVVRGILWRCTNPNLTDVGRERWVHALMDARRAIKREALHPAALAQARSEVNAAKIALGERGDPWWEDGSPCYNRHKVDNTPYAAWYQSLKPVDEKK
jgi:hypothetical protein